MSTLPSLENLPSPETFKQINKFTLALFRLGFAPWLWEYPKFIVLVHQGRKSGLKRYTPVNYTMIDGDLYCMAGSGASSQWYQNLQATPEIEVWMGNLRRVGQAETVTDPEAAFAPTRQILINSGPAGRAWFRQDPATLPDSTIREVVKNFPIVRIRLTGSAPPAAPGEPQPGDLVWVWGIVALIMGLLIGLLLLRPRKK